MSVGKSKQMLVELSSRLLMLVLLAGVSGTAVGHQVISTSLGVPPASLVATLVSLCQQA